MIWKEILGLVGFLGLHFVGLALVWAGEEQDKVSLEPIVITATRVPIEFSELGRTVSVIDSETIRNSSAHSVEEALEYALGVDMQHRGGWGVQSDVSVRGSTYAQTSILVNGMRVNDPQTGHHNLDLGLTLDSIERIEVLRGHGSSLYGPDAFGGVINIITKPSHKKAGYVSGSFGSHSTVATALGVSDTLHNCGMSFSFEKRESDGYRYDTDFDIQTFSSHITVDFPEGGSADLLFGYTDKEFGANDFYGAYPSKEWTDTIFTSLGVRMGDKMSLEPKMYYRRHKDKFILDITRPTWWVNHHTTDVYGTQLQSTIPLASGYLIAGGEAVREDIESTNLGNHSLSRAAAYIEREFHFQNEFIANAGSRADYYSNFGWEWTPTITGRYRFSPANKMRFSIGRCFRVPSFTELYYETASNIGNSELTPEKAFSYEIGMDYTPGDKISLATTLFWRDEKDVIDWIAEEGIKAGTATNPWKAKNVGEVEIGGVEVFCEIKPKAWNKLSVNYTFMESDSEVPEGYVSKYAQNHSKHHFSGAVEVALPFGTQTLKATYKKRNEGDDFILLDARLSRGLTRGELFMEVTNILNTSYEEIAGIPMPGRWFQAGVKIDF